MLRYEGVHLSNALYCRLGLGYKLRTLRLSDSLDLVDGIGIARESVVNLLDVFLSNQRALRYCSVGGFSVSLSLRCPIGQ